MKTKDEKLTEIVVLTLLGRVNAVIGLTMLITHAYFGRPEHLTRPLIATTIGSLLLAAAASRLNDARWLTNELVRGLAFAARGSSPRPRSGFYFRCVPHSSVAATNWTPLSPAPSAMPPWSSRFANARNPL